MILVIGAVSQEAAAIRVVLTGIQGAAMGRGWRLWSGQLAHHTVLLLQSGMGMTQAQASLKQVLACFPITGILNIGLGGAAAPGLEAGELIVCSTCHLDCAASAAAEAGADAAPVLPADPAWLHLARARLDAGCIGGCVSVERLAISPAEKRRLGMQHLAQVIDMESYALAQQAVRSGLPFLAVKAISDTLDERLPPFDDWLRPGGGLRWRRAAAYWAAHPQDVGLLARLYRNTRRACACLSLWARQTLPLMLEV